MARLISAEEIGDASLAGRKVAILGYGNQGRAQALNLKDEGVDLLIGQRPGASYDRAKAEGMRIASLREAARECDVLMFTLPDEAAADLYATEIEPEIRNREVVLLFTHGFNIHFGFIQPPETVGVALVAPKGQAKAVRDRYVEGSGVAGLIALYGGDETTLAVAYGYAKAAGYTRCALFETTFAEETETDLFGEQAVLCGGMIALMEAAYETLVEAGYSPEMAYFECVQETKLIVDLVAERGLAAMRKGISDTAEWGGYLTGERLVTLETKAEMRRILAEIRSGEFARAWVAEARDGKPRLHAKRTAASESPMESVGRSLRAVINR